MQPNSYLDPVNVTQPLSGYTCQGSTGVCTVTDDNPNIGHNSQAYLQDSWRMSNLWQLDYGLRYDDLQLSSAQFARNFDQVSPRVKLTRFVGAAGQRLRVLRPILHAVCSRERRTLAPRTSSITPLQRSVASFDLQPQRDSVYEVGAHLPVGRGELGLRVMQKNATNWVDDTEVGDDGALPEHQLRAGARRGARRDLQLSARERRNVRFVARAYVCAKTRAARRNCSHRAKAEIHSRTGRRPITTSVGTRPRHSRFQIAAADGFSLSSEYGSGLTTDPSQCSPASNNCKVPPHLIFNIEKGIGLGPGRGAIYVRVLNALNDHYYITYLNAQGNHVGMPRDVEFGYRFAARTAR